MFNQSKDTPYSYFLRNKFEFHENRDNITYTQTEILNKIMELAVNTEIKDKYIDGYVTKDQYFAVLYEVIEKILFSKNIS